MDVTVEGAIAIYHMKVDVDVALVPMSAITSLKQATREHACSDTGMNNTIALGGGYRYIWTDKNGAVIGETTIDSC